MFVIDSQQEFIRYAYLQTCISYRSDIDNLEKCLHDCLVRILQYDKNVT